MLSQTPDVSLIFPAYNEAKTICNTVAESVAYFRNRGYSYEIIVSADGEDGTREAAREFAKTDPAVKVIGERDRRGKGKGIRDGVVIASGAIIGFADADNKVPITEFDKIHDQLLRGVQVVIGSRALDRSKIERKQPLYRRLGSKSFGLFLHAILGMPGIRDTQCGFKFFPKQIAKELFSRQKINGYMFDVEILALALRLGYQIVEVPVRWRDDADSRLQLISGNIQNLKDIFRISLSCGRQSRVAPAIDVKATNADVC